MLLFMKSSPVKPMTHTLAVSLIPNQHGLIPASGWAVIAGLLASRPWILEGDLWQNNANWMVKTILLWLLFDPILGTIWQLLIKNKLRRTINDGDTIVLHGTPNLPYVTRNSAAYRWLVFRENMGRQSAASWQSLFLLTGLALALSAIFGWGIFLAVTLSLGVMWILGGTDKENSRIEEIWQMLLQFILPFASAILVFGTFNLPIVLFVLTFALVFGGSLRLQNAPKWGEILLILGLSTAGILLFALRLPIAGTVAVMAGVTTILFRHDIVENRYQWRDRLPSLNATLWLTLVVSAWFMGGLAG